MRLIKLLLASAVFLLMADPGFAQDQKVKFEDWQLEMNKLNQKSSGLQKDIDSLDGEIVKLKQAGVDTDKGYDDTWADIYKAVGTDKAGVEEMKKKLAALEARVNEFAKLNDAGLSQKIKELDSLKAQINENKLDNRYALTEIFNKVNDLVNRVDQLITRGKNYTPPKPKHDTYVVSYGDYLWRISGKRDVYADPFQWLKIYSANRNQIKNPDLIWPKQSFIIPRSVESNEVWVKRGDNLKEISNRVYGTPAKWVKIYNANKSLIDGVNKGGGGSLIYPHTILMVPKD